MVGTVVPDSRGRDRKYSFLNVPYDNLKFDEVIELIGRVKGSKRFFYIVTPNVDHAVRMRGDLRLNDVYGAAWLSLCDSRPIYLLARFLFCKLSLVTGSDLTAHLFHEKMQAGDKVALIAPYEEVSRRMAERFPHIEFRCHVPPANVIANPDAMKACVEFVASQRADFVFIAIGSPQSELTAYELSKMPEAIGVCICCGASLEFITNLQKRAPIAMQRLGFEWLYRLMSDPRRLWRRYVFAVPPLIWMCGQEVVKQAKHVITGARMKSTEARRLRSRP